MDILNRSRIVWLWSFLGLLVFGCGEDRRIVGVVEQVDAVYEQVLVEQPGRPGLLPAGSVSLKAAAEVQADMKPGQLIEMDVVRGESGPEIRSARFIRWAGEGEGWIDSGGQKVRAEPAAPIALEDTEGQSVTLDDLKGQIVLIDFIYTTCHGPCPAQTHNMRRVQRGLSDQARSRVQFLSVTIDPENDDAAALSAYAKKHGVDLSDWAFLTGPAADVEAARRAYHIGVTDAEQGGLDHSLRSYVIDDRGYLVDRYRSESFDADQVIERLEALAQEAKGRGPLS
ncbi:MAG: hypothetical protein CBC48_08760 [bacterium TMED88]|nr:hypothetical protein [Deltaproteobacteria bacterium]OUV32146.1 MAG: hypothetical protein CBC48_08760 [bacterium TMED88]